VEALFETKSIPALLAFIAIFLCFGFVKGLVEFLWKMKKDKDTQNDGKIKKLERDMRRAYTVIKFLAGNRWGEIRKKIMEDED
jgi:hypothetical protein